MKTQNWSKIVVGICLVLLLAMALPLTSACGPAPTPTPTPTPGPAPTPTPGPAPTPTPGPAPAWEPPEIVRLCAPTVTGTGFVATAAMVAIIEEATGVKFSLTPAAKTAGRAKLLKEGSVDIGMFTSLDMLFGLRGIEEFAEWGPQSMRCIWDWGPLDQGIGTRANSGIKTFGDFIGRRVATYPTYPTLQLYMTSVFAYANLSWDDVVPIQISSFGAGQKAVLDGAVDAAVVSGTSGVAFEIDASMHGLYWVPMPNVTEGDKAAWARFYAKNPSFYPRRSTIAAGASEENPVDIWAYNYQPAVYDWSNQDLVYWFVKQMNENYDAYKDTNAYLKKGTLEHSLKYEMWFSPRAEGTIRYYKEIGMWTPEMEAKQQEVLAMYPQTMTE